MRRVLVVLALGALGVVGCGPDDAEEAATESPTPTPTSSPTEATETSPDPEESPTAGPDDATEEPGATETEADGDPADGGPEPVGAFSTETRESEGFPSTAGEVALLTDVRIASHEGFDRFVFEFDGEQPPQWRVGLVEPPILEDGSGREVDVAGEAFLEIRATPASGVDLTGEEADPTYTGENRIDGEGGVIVEATRTGDFEAHLAWVLGLEAETGFAVEVLEDPLRVVVDVEAP